LIVKKHINLYKRVHIDFFMLEKNIESKIDSPIARPKHYYTVGEVYTTGKAAKISYCSQQTIIRCFDSGLIKGFKVPGSKFRRIPHKNLVEFIQDNEISLDKLEWYLIFKGYPLSDIK